MEPRTTYRDREHHNQAALRVTLFVAASTSLVALLTHVAGLVSMRFFLSFVGVPSLVALVALVGRARLVPGTHIPHSVVLGLAAGTAATIAYDAIRMGAQATGLFRYNAFYAIHVFGGWIVNRPPSSGAATAAGWVYHYWNGLSFAVMYTLAVGRGRWWWGLAYGLVMEVVMLGLFPRFLVIGDKPGFVTISLVGHVAYGAVLGAVVEARGVAWTGEDRMA